MPDRKIENVEAPVVPSVEDALVFNESATPEYISEVTRLHDAWKNAKAKRQSCALHGTDEECDIAKQEYNVALDAFFAKVNPLEVTK